MSRLGFGLLCGLVACADQGPPPVGPAPAAGPSFLFDDVRVFDGEKMLASADVLVRGDRIVEIGSRIDPPAGAQVVAGAGHTLLPGLIDAHAHVWDGSQLTEAAAFGVTTVLDMLTSPTIIGPTKERLAGPDGAAMADFRSAGNAVTAPGGHGTEYGIPMRTITGAGEAAAFVAACKTEGSDYIKIIYDPRNPRFKSIDRATMAAVVAAAHQRGMLAVAHIETQDDAREALEAGVDGLAHLFLRSEPRPDFARLAATHKAFVVPTLSVLSSLAGKQPGKALASDAALAPFLTAEDAGRLTSTFGAMRPADVAVAQSTVRQLVAAGVPILTGTDAPNPGTTYGASVHGEIALLVEAGLSPVQALAAATSAPARAFRLADRGRIAPGMRADLLLVAGDPSRDVRATRAIAGIWVRGVRVDRDAYRASVERSRANAAAPGAAPGGLAAGLVSDFEDGQPSARFGQGWSVSTDKLMGGKSTAALAVSSPGARGSKAALKITGEVAAGQVRWAGALFSPGSQPMAPVDLSSKKTLVVWARGDAKAYQVMLFVKSRGYQPIVKPMAVGKAWSELRLPLSSFDGIDGHDIMGVFFGTDAPGKFNLELDDVSFAP